MNLHTTRLRSGIFLAIVAGAFWPAAGFGDDDINRARSAYAEWATIKTQTSSELGEWRRERAFLSDTLEAARAESTALDDKIREFKESSTESDRRRAELIAQIDEAKSTATVLATKATEAEKALGGLIAMLPAPLVAELQPVIQALPADPEKTTIALSQRIRNVAFAMAQIEKFNTNFNLVSEIRDLGEGRSVEVKTLYIGLGTAYFADATGTTAGYGAPGETGWVWKSADPETAAKIADAIAIHENSKPPAFVSLPVEVR